MPSGARRVGWDCVAIRDWSFEVANCASSFDDTHASKEKGRDLMHRVDRTLSIATVPHGSKGLAGKKVNLRVNDEQTKFRY